MKSKLVIALFVLTLVGMIHAVQSPADINFSGKVDIVDFALFADQWLEPVCDGTNNYCHGADLDGLNGVDFEDLMWFATDWLWTEPSGVVFVHINNDPGVSGHEGFDGYMSKYETTNAQYCQFLNSAKAEGLITVYNDDVYAVSDTSHSEIYFNIYSGSVSSRDSQISYDGSTFSVRSRDGYDMSNHPVVEVSWYGATAFCNYYGYRLPTEWEWQAVADYDGSYTYGCGTTINTSIANYRDSTHRYGTTVVGDFGTYGYGMADMAGNVSEWTSSLGDLSYNWHLLRGGSWNYYDYSCTVSFRVQSSPSNTDSSIGFRVCR